MKRVSLFLSLFLVGGALFAQNEQDALRYSRIGFGGTARFSSMAGAFGAVGGDMSVMSYNPAGIALFRKNEMTFTPSLFSQNVKSDYNGTMSEDSRYNLRFDNFGFVFAGPTENTQEKGWQGLAMGIGYNRYASYQANVWMSGQARTSMMDSWAKTAGGVGPAGLDYFNEGLAWNAYLLNTVPGDTTHYTDTIPDGDLLSQEKRITMRGGMGEWVFCFGGNYSNKLYIGASVGIPTVRYEETTAYTEQEVVDTTSDFNALQFSQSLVTRGRGINFKFGIIYRPVDLFRIGFSFSSPTVLRLSDAYSSEMQSSIGNQQFDAPSPDGTYSYTIRTPFRFTGSLAVLFGNVGLISADVELVDYSDARIRANDYNFTTANNAIQSKYTMAPNVRIGGEFRVLPLVFRGGFAYYSSPYAASVNNNASRLYFTGGVGYRDEDDSFFIDLGVISNVEKSNYYFYDQTLVNPVHNTWKATNVMLTVGFRY